MTHPGTDPATDPNVEPEALPDDLPPAEGDPEDVPPPDLGEKGKKALDSMKEQRNAAKARARELQAELDELKKPKPATEGEPVDIEAIKRAAREEAAAESLAERALDKLEARAAKLFEDPDVARALLAGRVEEFLDGSKIDAVAIEEALNDLLTKRPHLAAKATRRFGGSGDGGARNGSQVSQLTEHDLRQMSPEQIDAARIAGKLNNLLGIS